MIHEQLVTRLLTAHGAVLLVVVAAYYKYGDRSDYLMKSLQGIDALLSKMRRRLTGELGAHLAPMIKAAQAGAAVSPLVGPRGETYREEPAALTESEAFKDSLQKFVEGNAAIILDYRVVFAARQRWCFWARALSWCLLIGLVWLIPATGFMFVLERCLDTPLADWQLGVIATLSGLTVASVLATLPFQLIAHDKIIHFRVQYDSP